MIDIARNIVPCSDKQDMKSRNGSYFQPSFSTRKRQRISSDLIFRTPSKTVKNHKWKIWTKATYSFSSQTLCTISSKVIRMWASLRIFVVDGFAHFQEVKIAFFHDYVVRVDAEVVAVHFRQIRRELPWWLLGWCMKYLWHIWNGLFLR